MPCDCADGMNMEKEGMALEAVLGSFMLLVLLLEFMVEIVGADVSIAPERKG